MKKHRILFWVEIPSDNAHERIVEHSNLTRQIEGLRQSNKMNESQMLGYNVWLLPRSEEALRFISQGMEQARLKNISCHVKFVEEEA